MPSGLLASLLLQCCKDMDVRHKPGMMTFAPYSIGDRFGIGTSDFDPNTSGQFRAQD
jgi:hypothetical protein